MKHLLLVITLLCLAACGADSSDAPENNATELRDWAKDHTSRAEITTKIAEVKMTLRVVEMADPDSAEAKELRTKLEELEKELKELASRAKD